MAKKKAAAKKTAKKPLASAKRLIKTTVKKSASKKSGTSPTRKRVTPRKPSVKKKVAAKKKPSAKKPAKSAAKKAVKKKPQASAGRLILSPSTKTSATPGAYEKHRDAAAERARFQSSGKREIGAIPPVADPQRRQACQLDLQLGLETYFPDIFYHGWSSQHIEVIDALNQALRTGGMFALGMPRASGKTMLCIHTGILAMLYSWRRYLVLIGATAEAASEMLDVIKMQLECNELLLADFPEICFPVWQLQGISQRAKGQTVAGEQTHIKWSGRKKIIFPTVYRRGRALGGSVIQTIGLLGRIRGMVHQTPEGKAIRPDVFLGDDLQTDQSAKSVAQVERRQTVLNGAVMGLAGPGKRIAGLATVTIVQRGDLADRLLDRKLNPHWLGRTFSLVQRWPTHSQLWEQYAELREVDLAQGKPLLPTATAFYAEHRKLMDAGAIVPWAQRKEEDELSALQSAYNLKLANPTTFDAEYQNDPQVSNTAIGLVAFPKSDDIVARINGYDRLDIPTEATHLFTGIDVQMDVLYWVQLALADNFTGWVVDYGTYPEQPLGAYWTIRELQLSLREVTGIADVQGAWFAGLNQLLTRLYDRQYIRDDGAAMAIDQTIIDANYGDSSKSVYAVCRQSIHKPWPYHGRGITAKQQPIAMRKRKPGERGGDEWFIASSRGTKTPRHVISDTNLLKTMIARRFLIAPGSPGAWTLFKSSVAGHRMLADQVTAEYPIETEGRGRKLLEWSLLLGRDNHFLDCLTMASTLGLMAGCAPHQALLSGGNAKQPKKSLSQLRAEAQARKIARKRKR